MAGFDKWQEIFRQAGLGKIPPTEYDRLRSLKTAFDTLTEQSYSWLVYKKGDLTLAKNGSTGEIIKGKDASVVIQSAIDALTRGGRIYIKAGTYTITAKLSVTKSSIAIEGEGIGTVLQLADNVNDDILEIGDGVNYQIGVRVANLRLKGNKANQTAGNGIHVYGMEEAILENLRIEDIKETGILLEGTVNRNTKHTFVFKNVITGCDFYGIHAKNYAFNDKIVGNEINNCKRGILLEGVSETEIIGGSSWGNSEYGIHIYGSCSEIRVIGVLVIENQKHGIVVQNAENGHIEIIGNSADENGVLAVDTYSGIVLIADATKTCSGIIVIANSSDGENQQKYGIAEMGDGVVDDNIIAFNVLRRNVTSPIEKRGPNTIVKDNIGYVTENSGAATITAGYTTVNVPHDLDITPDINKIQLTPKTDTGGKRWWIEAHATSPETYFVIKIDSSHTSDITFGWSYD